MQKEEWTNSEPPPDRNGDYCQDRGIDDTEQPLTPALSPSEGEREQPRQLWV